MISAASINMFQIFYIVLCVLIVNGAGALKKSPSVIIVGAGPAGIAAATKLLQNSITNITILEAENRIGGRIHSVPFDDGFVDLGAEYCHGEKDNVVYELVKDLDLLEHSVPLSTNTTKLYYSNGSTIDLKLTQELETIIENYASVIDTKDSVNSLEEAFLSKYNSTIIQKYVNDDQHQIVKEALKLAQNIILMHEGAFSLGRPAAGRHYQACEGDQGMSWKKGGYHSVLDVLMQNLAIDDKINLNQKVTKIIWNNSSVIVETLDNSTFMADHVIFTASIGVLRENRNRLFAPALPDTKHKAIEAIGFDGVIKVLLHFPDIWWKGQEDTMFFFLWSDSDLKKSAEKFPYGPRNGVLSWVTDVAALSQVLGNPHVLVAWISGVQVPQIEETPEEIVKDGVMFVVRKFLGRDYNITDPDKVIRSQWRMNPNFLGTYSYEKNGYFEENVSYQDQLSEPLNNSDGKPVVLFAGEATHPKVYSTVHGAVESGWREAQRILSLYL